MFYGLRFAFLVVRKLCFFSSVCAHTKTQQHSAFISARSVKWDHRYALVAPLFACGTFLSVLEFLKENTAKRVFLGGPMCFAPDMRVKIGSFTGRALMPVKIGIFTGRPCFFWGGGSVSLSVVALLFCSPNPFLFFLFFLYFLLWPSVSFFFLSFVVFALSFLSFSFLVFFLCCLIFSLFLLASFFVLWPCKSLKSPEKGIFAR